MDTCHVLLGHPWLFDRGVMHNGRLNTYTFTKDHKKITLTPLKISSFPSPKTIPSWMSFLPHSLSLKCMSISLTKSGSYSAMNQPRPRHHTHPYCFLSYMTFLMSFHKRYPMAYLQSGPSNTRLTLYPVLPSQTNRPIG